MLIKEKINRLTSRYKIKCRMCNEFLAIVPEPIYLKILEQSKEIFCPMCKGSII